MFSSELRGGENLFFLCLFYPFFLNQNFFLFFKIYVFIRVARWRKSLFPFQIICVSYLSNLRKQQDGGYNVIGFEPIWSKKVVNYLWTHGTHTFPGTSNPSDPDSQEILLILLTPGTTVSTLSLRLTTGSALEKNCSEIVDEHQNVRLLKKFYDFQEKSGQFSSSKKL